MKSLFTSVNMEETEDNPSLPPNYVSILQLRELWLKEKERNQKEKDEQRRLKQKAEEQKVQRSKLEEKHDRKSEVGKIVVQKRATHRKSWSTNRSRQFQRYSRVVSASNPRTTKERCTKTEEPESEALVADPQIERDKKKKKSTKKKCGEKEPKAESEELQSTSRAPEDNFKEETREMECELGVHKGKKNVRTRKVNEKKGMWSQCGSEAGNLDEMKEMEHKLTHISGSFEIKSGGNGLIRTYRGTSEGNRKFRDHQNLHRRGAHKQRDFGMVWVRKDEASNCTTDGSRLR